jgi:hypothetical protein
MKFMDGWMSMRKWSSQKRMMSRGGNLKKIAKFCKK